MTRFARAKGSKSSNQRIPDEGTSWTELQQQLKSSTSDSNVTESIQGETNWKVVINNEKKVEENLNSIWCAFSDNEDNEMSKPPKKKTVHSLGKLLAQNNDSRIAKQSKKRLAEDATETVSKNSHKRVRSKSTELKEENSVTIESSPINFTSLKEADKPSDWVEGFEWKDSEQDGSASMQKYSSVKFNQKITNNKFKGSKNWSITGREFKKFSSDKHKRRKLDQGDITLDVNGESIVVTKLDGFYIRKEDAMRIKELEGDMLKRGISKEEIRAVVKRERRNAEKSLARQKKKVCFHCRRGGHNLSSCPNLSQRGAHVIGSGICYKCGSTEHSHLQCRVASGQTYKFATCFICKEEGHIAKQCPDNPRGLYPDGGGCKLCGDVTHFKKDCPRLPTKDKVTVGTIDRNIETLPDIEQRGPVDTSNLKKKKKIIKFK